MKKVISLVLCLIMVLAPVIVAAPEAGAVDYYPKYTGNSVSIVDALKSIGFAADSSYYYRTKIAAANNIKDYHGYSYQNLAMLDLLKQGKLQKVAVATPASGCYAVYTGNSVSIVDALKSLGVESSYAYRALIAKNNNIQGYCGTAAQNLYMLSLLKEGKLVKGPVITTPAVVAGPYYTAYKGSTNSIVDALKSIGVDSSYAHRARIAAHNNIENYRGTSDQNLYMLSLLKQGKLSIAA